MSQSIVLLGMAGVGKSTIGKVLARNLNSEFLDLDDLIIKRYRQPLQDIINDKGVDAFLAIEEKVACSIQLNNMVIAPGGSIVYSKKAMLDWKHQGALFVFLENDIGIIRRRIRNIESRGIVGLNDVQDFDDLFYQRQPLYKKYANIHINCYRKRKSTIMKEILVQLSS